MTSAPQALSTSANATAIEIRTAFDGECRFRYDATDSVAAGRLPCLDSSLYLVRHAVADERARSGVTTA
jgi:hypothetical protein